MSARCMEYKSNEEWDASEQRTLDDAAKTMFQDYKFHCSNCSTEHQDFCWDKLSERTKDRWRNVASRWLS